MLSFARNFSWCFLVVAPVFAITATSYHVSCPQTMTAMITVLQQAAPCGKWCLLVELQHTPYRVAPLEMRKDARTYLCRGWVSKKIARNLIVQRRKNRLTMLRIPSLTREKHSQLSEALHVHPLSARVVVSANNRTVSLLCHWQRGVAQIWKSRVNDSTFGSCFHCKFGTLFRNGPCMTTGWYTVYSCCRLLHLTNLYSFNDNIYLLSLLT